MVDERVGEAYELEGQLTVVGHQALSSHRSEEFGRSHGVLIKEWRMLRRAVFVLDSDRQLLHVEYVDNRRGVAR